MSFDAGLSSLFLVGFSLFGTEWFFLLLGFLDYLLFLTFSTITFDEYHDLIVLSSSIFLFVLLSSAPDFGFFG